MESLGQRIKKFRKQKGLSQKELGEKLNVSQQMIGQYESNWQSLKPVTIKKIASALEITEQELLGFPDQSYNMYKALADGDYQSEDGDFLVIGDVLVTEARLLRDFNKLNSTGKKEAIRRVSELQYVPDYTAPDDLPFD